MMDFKGKRTVVLGLGISGLASAKLLKNLGASVFVSDKNESTKSKELSRQLTNLSIPFELGKHTKQKIEETDYIIVSPGVPSNCEPIQWAKNKNIEVIGEIELGYQFCRAPIIATTGTNGKTTVTTLIGRILEATGKKSFVLGNIGKPFTAEVDKIKSSDFVSLEVSSFQLETIKEFRPKISLILNFTPDHLDRYKNLNEYLEAKKRIFLNQRGDDFVVLNYADSNLSNLANETKAKVVFFGGGKSGFDENKFNPNQLAVLKVAEILGLDLNICFKALSEFKGIEHRMEFVANIGGVDFVNDSKGTNVDSTIWGLKNSVKPLILIAGGRDKGSDFTVIKDLVNKKVKHLVLFGEAKEKIKKALGAIVQTSEAKNIEEAVNISFNQAENGDCVLLSPMCASFDMFSNYEERGRIFKDIVRNLASSCKVKN
ncbi:MAG: UDP-N-acetylmuramoyl-L-alanine--D-glutamate ligase [Candidatus Omnitrophica bacterium]|nr:UDP-N-acetylmuramoyl-L-alanine--D-glutamate ligase [Candidatus Omnitrophota bacterium]